MGRVWGMNIGVLSLVERGSIAVMEKEEVFVHTAACVKAWRCEILWHIRRTTDWYCESCTEWHRAQEVSWSQDTEMMKIFFFFCFLSEAFSGYLI